MTGFCGWIGGRAPDDPAVALAAMAARLAAPDGSADYRDATPRGALAARGLAAETHGLIRGPLAVALAGYPRWIDPSLAAYAAGAGHAATLAEAWRRHGKDLLAHLEGAVSIAVVDFAAEAALVAIDRLGVCPLAYAETAGGGLAFGSTADAVRAHPGVDGALSAQGLYDYLFFYTCPAPGTIWRAQRKLLPGHYLHWRRGRLDTAAYWRMRYEPDHAAPADALAAELRATLAAAVRRASDGENPDRIGAFLSGGLDSTSVAAFLVGDNPAARLYTVGFADEGFDEMPFARVGARHIGARHVEHYLTAAEAAAAVPLLATAFDEPFGNSSAIPAFACARVAAAEGIEVLLAGDGGDEIFAGNSRYLEQLGEERRRGLVAPILPLLRPLFRGGRLGGLLHRLAHTLPGRLYADNPFVAGDPAAILDPGFLSTVDRAAPLAHLDGIWARAGSDDPVQRMMFLDLQVTLADNDLRKVGRASAMAGVRVRYPMLDEALVAFSGRVPPALLLSGGELRRFYKDAMAGILPPEILGKKKHGFGMPFGNWLRAATPLRAIALDAIDRFGGRGYLRPGFTAALRDDLAAGRSGPYTGMAWDLMMLELWLADRRVP